MSRLDNIDNFIEMIKEVKERAGIPDGKLHINTDDETRASNIEHNIRLGHKQVFGFLANDRDLAIVGGGWSLKDTIEELRELYYDGVEIVALNNAGNFLLENGIKPHAVTMLDARQHNVRFVEKPIHKCKYFLASQCHPDVFESCRDRDVYIWHTALRGASPEEEILDRYYLGNWHEIPGSSTIGLRTIFLMRILGYTRMHVFGMDSCYSPVDNSHHSYAQPENDGEEVIPVGVGGKTFRLSAWQLSQALDFLGLVKAFGDKIRLNVHGDGFIAHLVKTGADIDDVIDGSQAA